MFAASFADVRMALTATPLFFVSPFLGILVAVMTQIFLLRRVVLFISSLDLLWPLLAHPATKYSFSFFISLTITISNAAGVIATYEVWQSGGLWNLTPSLTTAL
jgi:hypothetical protein